MPSPMPRRAAAVFSRGLWSSEARPVLGLALGGGRDQARASRPSRQVEGSVVPVPVCPALHSRCLSGFSIGPWGWTGDGAFPACCPCEQASARPSCSWDSPLPASPRVQSWHWPTPARPLPPT